jgi:hypothetical protein
MWWTNAPVYLDIFLKTFYRKYTGMKNKLPSEEEFFIKDVAIADTACLLIYPKLMGVKWNESNKWFRSSIWTKDALKPVSLGFRKFTNFGEQPDFEPLDLKKSLKFIQKIDGSCLILSKFKGEFIARTRGTADLSTMPNGFELELFKEKYPKLFNTSLLDNERLTLLLEWTTPTNIIVLRESEEPELRLIGAVRHVDYAYYSQSCLDEWAKMWDVPRPKVYEFNSFGEMQKAVEAFESTEGVVIYGNEDQVLKKVKSLKYLKLHKLKDKLSSDEAILDLYLSSNKHTYREFLEYVNKTIDFEIMNMIRVYVSDLFVAKKEVDAIITCMHSFVARIKTIPSRKEQAQAITSAYGSTGNTSMLFMLLDGKPLTVGHYKKLYTQVLYDE